MELRKFEDFIKEKNKKAFISTQKRTISFRVNTEIKIIIINKL